MSTHQYDGGIPQIESPSDNSGRGQDDNLKLTRRVFLIILPSSFPTQRSSAYCLSHCTLSILKTSVNFCPLILYSLSNIAELMATLSTRTLTSSHHESVVYRPDALEYALLFLHSLFLTKKGFDILSNTLHVLRWSCNFWSLVLFLCHFIFLGLCIQGHLCSVGMEPTLS